jgi:hypothetical protein
MLGGLCTTPTDYSKFLIEIIAPKPSDAFRLNKDSLEAMLHPQVKCNSQSSWALGWDMAHTENGNFIQHGGGHPGYSCFVAVSVERKSGYVIMTNGEKSGFYGVIAKLTTGEIPVSVPWRQVARQPLVRFHLRPSSAVGR